MATHKNVKNKDRMMSSEEKNINDKMSEERQKFIDSQPTDEEMTEKIIAHLKEIYDPELPVNIYDLGLIYNIDTWTDEVSMMKKAKITMTLTSATCSFSQVIIDLVKSIAARQEGLEEIEVEIVFDPPWSQDSMTDEAKLAMGLL
jgi:metal-sulfur cluster biosynthetic enzyme